MDDLWDKIWIGNGKILQQRKYERENPVRKWIKKNGFIKRQKEELLKDKILNRQEVHQ